ncbi:hypothetical protein LIER_01659 [Lithospermum erythrorhizon]|uniref:Uncharacterized protein n=1 Tax=Lithospermum erythrorhizon TaxID=34254 RepID=A0AAV3NLN6_LITER
MEIDPLVVNVKAQKWKEQKLKAKGSETPVSTSTRRVEGLVFDVIAIRSIPPVNAPQEGIQEEVQQKIHSFYLPWVDYTKIRELDNSRPSRVNVEDEDVGGEKSHDEINIEEDIIGEEVAPIVEEIVIDSSVVEMSKAADVSDPSVKDATSKTAEPSVVSNKSAEVGEDVPKGDGVDVSQVDEVVTEGVKTISVEHLSDKVESSVKDTMHGLNGDSTSRGDVLKPTIDDFVKDTMVEGMDAAIQDAVDTESVIAKAADRGDVLSVTDTNAETAGKEERPTIGQGVVTMEADIQEVIPENAGQKKKSKKRKHKKSVDIGEIFEPKKKLSKEERKAKIARKVERRAKRAAEEVVDADDEVHEEAEDHVQEHEVPYGVQLNVNDK